MPKTTAWEGASNAADTPATVDTPGPVVDVPPYDPPAEDGDAAVPDADAAPEPEPEPEPEPVDAPVNRKARRATSG